MTIRLEKLIPFPLLEQDTEGSGIWEADEILFEPGNRYIIEAPSGKGKTSLLSVIYGIRRDYRGAVYLNGTDIAGLSDMQWAAYRKDSLSFVFQGLELFEDLTGYENIQLKNAMTRHKSKDEIAEMAERLGIGPFLARKAGILSFGQQQRVAILRSLCQPFRFLLADECFSHIDLETAKEAFRLITDECRIRGAGLILTSLNRTMEFDANRRFQL